LGIGFDALSKSEQAAVAAHVRAEYDRIVFQQPTSYVTKNAQTDPEGWRDRLCELIASDPRRVQAIVNHAQRRAVGNTDGFTLIELSVVLVIIGLIVGGVLVGQNLIAAATVRAQISQIERFNTAADTFRGKYGFLPGDIPQTAVTQFGFTVIPTRPGTAGQGDGNGILEGYSYEYSSVYDYAPMSGETAWFWEDLSANSQLIEGNFNLANVGSPPGGAPPSAILPPAKLGGGNYVYTYSFDGSNYFGISIVTQVQGSGVIYGSSTNPGLTVQQAYGIDAKIDDGLPQSGNVTAKYQNWDLYNGSTYLQIQNYGAFWAEGGGAVGPYGTAANPGSAATCYDNGNVGGATQQYSIEISGGSNVNCALSFKMQAGD